MTRRGVWAVVDRGMFSASNFLLAVMLARWLEPASYGAFAIAFSVLLLFGSIHGGLLTEPMLVYGAGKYAGRFGPYLERVVRSHIAFGAAVVAASLVAALVSHLASAPELPSVFSALAVSAPLVLLQWTMRLACYVERTERLAALTGILYLTLLVAGAGVLEKSGALSPASAILLLGAASAICSVLIASRLCPRVARIGADPERSVFAEHWSYGRWAAATGVLAWIPGQVYYLVLPIWGGLEASGSLRALMNVVLPIMQVFAALSVVITTELVRYRSTPRFRAVVRWLFGVFMLAAAGYWILVGLTGSRIVAVLYSSRYVENADVIWLLGLLPVIGTGVTILAPALRAMERPARVFLAYGLSTAFSLTAGLFLVSAGGVIGASLALLGSTTIVSVTLLVEYRRTAFDTESHWDSSSTTPCKSSE